MTDGSAIEATIRAYTAAWAARDRDVWLDTFAPDGEQEDPVGDSVRRGPEEIGAFFDEAMTRYEFIEIVPREVYVLGDEAAMVWTINGIIQGGAVSFDGVDVFRFDSSACITSVRAFWSRAALHLQLQQLRDAKSDPT